MQTATLYCQDFYAYTQHQAELLQSGCVGELDIENLIKEIRSLQKNRFGHVRIRVSDLFF